MEDQSAGAGASRPTSRLVVDVVRALRGWVVAVAGGVLLLGCYLGVSGEIEVGRQLPYVVSGGFGGLALVGVGCALLIADRIEATAARNITASTQSRIAEQIDDLHALIVAASGTTAPTAGAPGQAAAAGIPAAPASEAVAAAGAPPVDDGSVYAVPGGRTYHRPGCELLAGKAAQRVEASAVAGRGLTPCSVCAPILVS
ncbi:MAG: hypothetical protein IRZ08_05200 [Frankia sp.]|nr:hypothetical protein [Frankia sp.]